MTRVHLTPAFLIHRRAFKDSSLLLDFFTQEHGKIRLVGRGSRKSKTALQMFQQMNISFSGRGELKTLTGWEVDDQPRNLLGETLILGMYGNELIARLLQEQDPHPELFEVYKQFIRQLIGLEKQSQYWLLRLFENNLLFELGYGFDFEADINGNEIDENAVYDYQPQSGFLLSGIGKISGKLIRSLSAENVLDPPDTEQLKVCRNLNRARLQPLLGEKPLQSRSLFFTKQ
ncbi:MAG: DNA repair protein RecO [Catillopecten margaritatus gill symbiont]|uniref:DNA repair protein RecO n=1 Tax=Catillopecten margaritatus gill symbiont TaxID=3083288 RepID=A0AAU6PIM1_9GAMM